MVKVLPALVALSASLSIVLSHGSYALERRAAPAKTTTTVAATKTTVVATGTAGTSAPEPSGCTTAYAPVAAGAWPSLDCIPFTQDPQVQQWLKLVDFTKVPSYPLSNDGLCPTDLTTIPSDQCWWTCQKCTAPTDVTFCPQTDHWGLTYDDGPSPDSPRLYDVLKAHNTKATLFIVGSRAISYPETLKRAYSEGHQIAIHTWSHPSMTSLSNEQIVAELKWTEKAIFSVIGVTPIYWRPPYGDVDNRVRSIATQLGYKTSIWTDGFDTDDWNIPAGKATAQSVVDTFKTWLTKIPTMNTGFIVLEHDLFPQEVNVSIDGILPLAYANKALVMEPIAKCIGDAKPYKEGAGTFVIGNNSTSGNSTSGSSQTASGSHSSTTASSAISKIGGSDFGYAVGSFVALVTIAVSTLA
ncbi:chitin deacetylase [Lunasporangiospora selenospora]|uniref:chitin deacetylase n=1 Tax=Lunasporangiospora selenospora TaxID=979761 RepID=A0A9P6G4A2_9FUNG|nr:chitin deacetylase [Lunasporangiospora selenospora]